MIRILHVISSLDPRAGGPVIALQGLITAQIKQGLEVRVVSTYALPFDDSVVQQLQRLGVNIKMVGPTRGPLQGHPSLAAILDSEVAHADILHIHALWEEIQHQAALIARRLNKPYIMRPCGMLDPWQLKQGWLKKRLYLQWRLRADLEGAAALHFTSEEEMRGALPLQLNNQTIVEANGVQLSSFQEKGNPERFRQSFGLDRHKAILLFLGRLHPKKGLDLLIPAFAAATLPDVHLVLAGPTTPKYGEHLKRLVAQYNLQDRVLFTGMLQGENKLDAFAAAELFVLPSYQENFGNAIVEALAFGTPVVISDQVNIYREISAAKVGGVVPMKVGALSDELTRWMTDGGLRQSAARLAPHFVAENYNWDVIARRWTLRYQGLTAGDTLG